jgi:hypothetical protein
MPEYEAIAYEFGYILDRDHVRLIDADKVGG